MFLMWWTRCYNDHLQVLSSLPFRQSSRIAVAQRGGDGRGTTRTMLLLLLGPSQMTHVHSCAKVPCPLCSSLASFCAMHGDIFAQKGGSSLQVRETKAAETTTFHRFLLVCLETPKPQSLFLEGSSGSHGGGKVEGRRKVRARERRPKPTQKPNFAGVDSAGGKHPAPVLQEWVPVEKGERTWGQGGAGGWSGSWEGGHIQECSFT